MNRFSVPGKVYPVTSLKKYCIAISKGSTISISLKNLGSVISQPRRLGHYYTVCNIMPPLAPQEIQIHRLRSVLDKSLTSQ